MATFKETVSSVPLPLVPAALGLLVLSGYYDALGFPLIHWIGAAVATVVALAYCMKIVLNFRGAIAAEYANPMLAALYPTLPMLIMVLCAFYAPLAPAVCATVFFIMLGILLVHVIVFFVRFFIRRFEWKTFMPSWYVTTNGVMVSTVAGMQFMPEPLAVGIVVWGIAIYVVVTPFMLWRMKRCEVAEAMMHSQAIMLGPCSMCLVSYANAITNPSLVIMGLLFACVVVSLGYVVAKLPTFFSVAFHPGYAAMTFPMAVGLLATSSFATACTRAGFVEAGWATTQLAGVQLVLATTIIALVAAKFAKMLAAGFASRSGSHAADAEQVAALGALRAFLRRGAVNGAGRDFARIAAGVDCSLDCENGHHAGDRTDGNASRPVGD